ncbi:MAG: hypothetical protein AMXMBFR4_25280 [Candidatus Hydrogenedentota bacterium]
MISPKHMSRPSARLKSPRSSIDRVAAAVCNYYGSFRKVKTRLIMVRNVEESKVILWIT